MRKILFFLCVTFLIACMLTGCNSRPTNVVRTSQLPQIYPDYTYVTIPYEIAPLNFAMIDDSIESIDVEVKGSKGGSLHAKGEYADFDIDEWQKLLSQNKGGKLSFTVCAKKDGKWIGYKAFTVFVSKDPLDEWGITYRRIPPGYEQYGKMGLYQRDLATFNETPLLENSRTPGQCLNCHTPNRTNPDQYVFHIRGSHGATALSKNGSIELLKAKNDTLGGSMVYPYWHPGGRYCAFSTNKTSQIFHSNKKNKRIEVFDEASDVFVYDTQTQRLILDTLIMRKGWSENTPAFSPDGRWLYFTTTRQMNYPSEYNLEKYSLCRVNFNDTTGRIGNKVDTLINATVTGKSASWPRPSYDGLYLMYTQTDYGYFSIWHPEADLWLLNLTTGETRPLNEVNSNRSESFHNWSTNSRWFLFTSRNEDGLYTKLYFSHFDEQGHASKPFLLPQRNPKRYYRQLMYSYNTPDFASRPINTNQRELANHIESNERRGPQ